MQVDCPCCGSKLEVTVSPVSALSLSDSKSRPAQSQYAAVRPDPVPPKAAPIPRRRKRSTAPTPMLARSVKLWPMPVSSSRQKMAPSSMIRTSIRVV